MTTAQRTRANEDQVLEAAAALDPFDYSRNANYIRTVADQINDHRENDEGRGDQLPCDTCGELVKWVGRAVAPGGFSHMDTELNGDHRATRRG